MASDTRIAALDRMRGLVMVLMAVDHASVFYNAGRLSDDTAATWVAGSALPMGQFLTRWMTHLCAPTFLFLAGTGLALSIARKEQAGKDGWEVDRDLLIRGAFIALLDVFYMSKLAGAFILQVLYAIGVSMICMVALRRLEDRWLLGLAGGWFVLGELLTDAVWDPPANAAVPWAMTVARYTDEHTWIFYPFVPWLAIMMLGWVFGRYLERVGAAQAARTLALFGVAGLASFALVRGLGGYGNMMLLREDGSLQQWLHVSKYPPSLTYATLELGLMALVIAGLLRAPARPPHPYAPLLVFGQTALFFYLAHFTLLGVAKGMFGIQAGGLDRAYLGAGAVLLVLYPACLGFRRLKRAYPRSVLRYV